MVDIGVNDLVKNGLKVAIFLKTGNAASLGEAFAQGGLRIVRDKLQESSPAAPTAPPRANPAGGQVVDEAA